MRLFTPPPPPTHTRSSMLVLAILLLSLHFPIADAVAVRYFNDSQCTQPLIRSFGGAIPPFSLGFAGRCSSFPLVGDDGVSTALDACGTGGVSFSWWSSAAPPIFDLPAWNQLSMTDTCGGIRAGVTRINVGGCVPVPVSWPDGSVDAIFVSGPRFMALSDLQCTSPGAPLTIRRGLSSDPPFGPFCSTTPQPFPFDDFASWDELSVFTGVCNMNRSTASWAIQGGQRRNGWMSGTSILLAINPATGIYDLQFFLGGAGCTGAPNLTVSSITVGPQTGDVAFETYCTGNGPSAFRLWTPTGYPTVLDQPLPAAANAAAVGVSTPSIISLSLSALALLVVIPTVALLCRLRASVARLTPVADWGGTGVTNPASVEMAKMRAAS